MKEWDEIDEMFSQSFGNDEVIPPKNVKNRIDAELFGGSNKLPWYRRSIFLLILIPLLFTTLGVWWFFKAEKSTGESGQEQTLAENKKVTVHQAESTDLQKNSSNNSSANYVKDPNESDVSADPIDPVHLSNPKGHKKASTIIKRSSESETPDRNKVGSDLTKKEIKRSNPGKVDQHKIESEENPSKVKDETTTLFISDQKDSIKPSEEREDVADQIVQSEESDSNIVESAASNSAELLVDSNEKKAKWSFYSDAGVSFLAGNRKGAELNNGSSIQNWQTNPGFNAGVGARVTFNNKFGISAGMEYTNNKIPFITSFTETSVSFVGYDSTYNQLDSTWTVTMLYDTTEISNSYNSTFGLKRYKLPILFSFSSNRESRVNSSSTGFLSKVYADFGLGLILSYNTGSILSADSLGFNPAIRTFGMDAIAQWGMYYPIGNWMVGFNMQGQLPILNTLDFDSYGIKPKSIAADFRFRLIYRM